MRNDNEDVFNTRENKSARKLLVSVIAMIGKLVANVNTGKSGKKYSKNFTSGTIALCVSFEEHLSK
jgi:hypothetical protein